MIVGREEIAILEKYVNLQTRIWNDAADVGLITSGDRRNISEEQKTELRSALAELMKIFDYKTEKYGTELDGGWSTRVFVPYEQDGDTYQGVMIQVGYHRSHRGSILGEHGVSFITIDIGSWHQNESGFKSN